MKIWIALKLHYVPRLRGMTLNAIIDFLRDHNIDSALWKPCDRIIKKIIAIFFLKKKTIYLIFL